MHSCLYHGTVLHARRSPAVHRFRYKVALAYVDLDEADELIRRRWLLSAARFAPASFRAEDHTPQLLAASTPAELAAAVRAYAEQELNRPLPPGPVRVLTQLRQFGHFFSPLNLHFCFDAATDRPAAIVAEVSNTPWNERRLYVLDATNRVNDAGVLRFCHPKDFHVSPFMDLAADYQWRLTNPGEQLDVAIRSVTTDRPAFTAAMSLARRPLSDVNLARMLVRFPVSSLQILAAIHWQAFRLWMKRCPFYPHPDRRPALGR